MHAILETARGVANVEEICGASPRMQGLSLGPADLAADRRMKTTRVGGGHPGYLVRQDPPRATASPTSRPRRATYQQDLWHYTIARMVDACAMHGIYPYYGPFGDIADVVACEDQFRNAFLLGCVGTWSLHPKQIAIANKVFSPSVEDVAHARRVVAAMGDGTGAVMLDGKMEDDASLKQCLVMVELAEQLAAIDPELKAAVRRDRGRADMSEFRPRRSRPLHAELQRARPGEGEDDPLRRADPRPRGRRRPRRQAGRPRGRLRRRGQRRVRPPRADHPGQRRRHRVARRRPGRRVRRPGPDAIVVPKVNSADAVPHPGRRDGEGTAPPTTPAVGDGRDAVRDAPRRGDRRRLRAADRAGDGHQRPGQGAVRRARARPRSRCSPGSASPCSPPAPPAR